LKTARISKTACAVKSAPSNDAESSSEVLFGETLLVQESTDNFSKVKILRDGYEGYIETDSFDISDLTATHWVANKATLVFERADIKSVVVRRILFGSELVIVDYSSDGRFLQLHDGGFVEAQHCLKAGVFLSSGMIEIGRQHYLNAPYLWGGRSSDGCDCSGLVQMLAMARGIDLPRDSKDQQISLNNDIGFSDRLAEDLVFWPGHVGLLESPDTLFHATAHSMRCCFEPLQQVIDRAGTPTAIKRLG